MSTEASVASYRASYVAIKDSKTALHYACSHCQFKTKASIIFTATLLIDYDANIEATDSIGPTALRLAFL
jgi:hypothetical protein